MRRAATTGKMSEAEFMRQVIQFAKLHRWRVAHFRPGLTRKGRWLTAVQGDGTGFPDLILIRGTCLIAAELKVGANKLTPEQREWLADFQLAGVPAFEWRPTDWPQIEEVLA